MSEKEVIEFFRDYRQFIVKYQRYQKIGFGFLGLTLGNIGANAVLPVLFREPRTSIWWFFVVFGSASLILVVSVLALIHRMLKHHIALHDSLVETFKTEPGSLRFNCALEQAQAAVAKLRIKSKNDSNHDIRIS